LRNRFGGLMFGGAYTWRGLFSEFYGIIFHFCFVDQSIFLPVLMVTTAQVVKTEFFIITEMTILKELRNEGTTLVLQTAGHSRGSNCCVKGWSGLQ